MRDNLQLENLGVGSFVGHSFQEMDDKRYLKTKKEHKEEVILLDTWSCPYCGHANWAYIIINNGIISEIKSTEISRDILNQANYISRNIAGEAMHISGNNINTVLGEGILETLEKYLQEV